jgi:hypothetical protein
VLRGALSAGAYAGLAATSAGVAACGVRPAEASTATAARARPTPRLPGEPTLVDPYPFDLTDLPFRQDDPRWADELMWDRELVIRAATELDGFSMADAQALLRPFRTGNSIGNEGCQLTCFSMVLRLLARDELTPWTPPRLNTAAHALMYYTPSGLSMTTLYADIVSEVTAGRVQLALKEEYLPGTRAWPQVFCDTAPLVRAYRSLPTSQRGDLLIMLKMGTYDDTVASHYVLLHPHDEGSPDDDDPFILDPAKPLDEARPWRLSDCAAWIKGDPAIGRAWERDGIEDTQIGGVWLFARWPEARDRSPLAPLLARWAEELAAT